MKALHKIRNFSIGYNGYDEYSYGTTQSIIYKNGKMYIEVIDYSDEPENTFDSCSLNVPCENTVGHILSDLILPKSSNIVWGYDGEWSLEKNLQNKIDDFSADMQQDDLAILNKGIDYVIKIAKKWRQMDNERLETIQSREEREKEDKRKSNLFYRANELRVNTYLANVEAFVKKYGRCNSKNHKLKTLFFYGIKLKKDITYKELMNNAFSTYKVERQMDNEFQQCCSFEKYYPNMSFSEIETEYLEMKKLFDKIILDYAFIRANDPRYFIMGNIFN